MTSKISIDNRELLQKISIGEASAGIDFGNAIVRELAAFRLAAMDSKPVAYMTYKGYLLHAGDQKLSEYSEPMPLYADPRPASTPASPVAWDYEWASCITCEGPQNFNRVIEREAPPEWAVEEGQARNIIPLYRHAQPALSSEPMDEIYAELYRLREEVKGPDGLNTWRDAAIAEKKARVELERQINQSGRDIDYLGAMAAFHSDKWHKMDPITGYMHGWNARRNHAQPATVVPDAYVRDERGRMMLNGVCEPKIGFSAGWNACRAAMLQEL
ncbi:TPA: hypothetical protein ACTW6H_005689, partial [Raoultella ornithinolytica]